MGLSLAEAPKILNRKVRKEIPQRDAEETESLNVPEIKEQRRQNRFF